MVKDQACVHAGATLAVHPFWTAGMGDGEETHPGATRRSDGAERSADGDLALLLLGASKLVFFWILSCSLSL